MLHANICESEKLSSISYEAETLYYRLLTRVDDNGNFTADPRIVYGQCLMLRDDMNPKRVAELLTELATVTEKDKKPLLEFYEVEGDRWLHITKFEDFQYLRPDRTASVKFPAHPSQMGPKAPNTDKILQTQRVTNGIPEVNQRETDGQPVGNQWYGIDRANISKEKLREEKISEGKKEETHLSFGQGDWKTLAIRFREVLGKYISATKTNKKQYSEFCLEYGEDVVLSVFNEWAAQNKPWLVDKDDPLFFFWKSLPENVEALAAEKETKKSAGPELTDQEAEQIIASSVSERQREAEEKLKQIEAQKKWDAEHQDEI